MAEDRAIAHLRVMRDVHVGHQQIVVADAGQHAASLGAAMDGDEFPELVAPSDSGFGSLAVDRKSTRLNSSPLPISYAVFCLKKTTRSYLVITRGKPAWCRHRAAVLQ